MEKDIQKHNIDYIKKEDIKELDKIISKNNRRTESRKFSINEIIKN